MEIFARERRISQVPNLESEVRERRVEKIEEDITERQSGRFSVKKTPEKGWKKVQQIAVRLSAEKYTENVDQQKTMETFINDNEEDRETAQSLEDRFHQVVVQAVAESELSRFSIQHKKSSTSEHQGTLESQTHEQIPVNHTIANRFSIKSVTEANKETTEESSRNVEPDKFASSNNKDSEVVAILKPEEKLDDSAIKPTVSKLSTRFSVKSVTEEKTDIPQTKTSVTSRFSIKSVSKDDSTPKVLEDKKDLIPKVEPHLSQSRFVIKSVQETDEQVPYETDNDSVFTEPDDQIMKPTNLEIMENFPEILPHEVPIIPVDSSVPIPPIPKEPNRFTICLIKTNGPDNQAGVKLNEIQEEEVFC